MLLVIKPTIMMKKKFLKPMFILWLVFYQLGAGARPGLGGSYILSSGTKLPCYWRGIWLKKFGFIASLAWSANFSNGLWLSHASWVCNSINILYKLILYVHMIVVFLHPMKYLELLWQYT